MPYQNRRFWRGCLSFHFFAPPPFPPWHRGARGRMLMEDVHSQNCRFWNRVQILFPRDTIVRKNWRTRMLCTVETADGEAGAEFFYFSSFFFPWHRGARGGMQTDAMHYRNCRFWSGYLEGMRLLLIIRTLHAEWGRCVAVCCSVQQCVAVCSSVLQCAAVCCSVLQCVALCVALCVAVCCSVLHCASVCCIVLQWRKNSCTACRMGHV